MTLEEVLMKILAQEPKCKGDFDCDDDVDGTDAFIFKGDFGRGG